jgi:hypothetical protein
LELEYDHTYMVRGLVVDKKRGNVLKMDRHKYVKVARHGFEPLSTESRIETYCATSAKADQFSGPGYANVDTLFALGETYLFCQLVQLKERYLREEEEEEEEEENENEDESEPNEEDDALRRRRALACKPFEKMYDEIRASGGSVPQGRYFETRGRGRSGQVHPRGRRVGSHVTSVKGFGQKSVFAHQLAVGLHERGDELPRRRPTGRGENRRVDELVRRGDHREL